MPVKGVKELVDEGIKGPIPERYITPEDVRVNDSQVMAEEGIPLIDFSSRQDRTLLVQQVAQAASEWGFFQVINHGVSESVLDSMHKAGLAYFNLPAGEKNAIFSEDHKLPLRFCTSFIPSIEVHSTWHDNLCHSFPPYGEDHPWPEKPETYRKAAMDYLEAVNDLSGLILPLLFEGLGLEPDYAKNVGRIRMRNARLNYYPPCPSPELAEGLRAHSDFGCVTILLQDQVGGLQVKKGSVWYWVKPVPNSLVINVGDQLQILSNGEYQSAEHRVAVNSTKARLSIVTFFEPEDDVLVEPARELISDDNPARYRENMFGNYRDRGFTTYLDGKQRLEEVKI